MSQINNYTHTIYVYPLHDTLRLEMDNAYAITTQPSNSGTISWYKNIVSTNQQTIIQDVNANGTVIGYKTSKDKLMICTK